MSRRLRTWEVRRLLVWLLVALQQRQQASPIKFIDTFPLRINSASGDREARVGRAATGKAKGYKLHLMLGQNGTYEAVFVAPMNRHEQKIAPHLIFQLPYLANQPPIGFLVGDNAYDGNKLYSSAAQEGLQLLAAARRVKHKDLGHVQQSDAKIRGKAWAAVPWGRRLLRKRFQIDRTIGAMAARGGGLTQPPAWVRTLGRVRIWCFAKLLLQKAHERMVVAA
jgi:hypothetical protein